MDALGRMRQLLRGGEAPESCYECRACGAAYELRHFVCPECRGFRVDRREWRLE